MRLTSVAIDGVLGLHDTDEPQSPRMTRRLWAELGQRARERENKTPRPSHPVPEGHTGRSAQQAGGPSRSARGSRPSAKRSTHSNTPRGTQKMSFKEQKSRERLARKKPDEYNQGLSCAKTAASGSCILCAGIRIRIGPIGRSSSTRQFTRRMFEGILCETRPVRYVRARYMNTRQTSMTT